MLLNDLYTILSSSHTDGNYTTDIVLNGGHGIFEGHFPGNPVLPGVCMMMIVQETLGVALNKQLHLQEAKMIKFLGVVNPIQNPSLTVGCELTATDTSDIQIKATIYTEGQVFYKANCTFLAN